MYVCWKKILHNISYNLDLMKPFCQFLIPPWSPDISILNQSKQRRSRQLFNKNLFAASWIFNRIFSWLRSRRLLTLLVYICDTASGRLIRSLSPNSFPSVTSALTFKVVHAALRMVAGNDIVEGALWCRNTTTIAALLSWKVSSRKIRELRGFNLLSWAMQKVCIWECFRYHYCSRALV